MRRDHEAMNRLADMMPRRSIRLGYALDMSGLVFSAHHGNHVERGETLAEAVLKLARRLDGDE